MSKITGAKRKDYFELEPERLTLITDPEHPLYDVRASEPLAEEFVRNVMFHGVLEPVLIRRNGEALEVVAGRQRVRAAHEANRRFEERGEAKMLVPCILQQGPDVEMASLAVSENEARRGDSVLVKSDKAQRLLNLGRTKHDLCVIFGVSMVTINTWLNLQNISTKLRQEVDAGKISASAAVEMASLSREEQEKTYDSLTTDKPVTGSRVKKVVKGDAPKKITSHKIKTEDFTPHPDGSSNVDMLTYCLNNLIKIKSSISAGDYGLNYKSGVLDGLIYSLEYALSKNKLDRDPLSYFKYVVS